MNRCLTLTPGRLLAALLLWNAAHGPAWAQYLPRQFPAAALRGTLQVTAPPEVLLNGKPDRLSPGARIRGTNHLLVLSGSLVGRSLQVNYVREPHGLIHEIWILSPEEAQEKRAGAQPATNFNFASDANAAVPAKP